MMNKFRGPNDANFELISSTVKEMVQEAKRITVTQREGKISPWAVKEPISFRRFSLTDTLNLAVHIHNEHFMVSRRENTLFTGLEKEIEDPQQKVAWPRIYVIHGRVGGGRKEGSGFKVCVRQSCRVSHHLVNLDA